MRNNVWVIKNSLSCYSTKDSPIFDLICKNHWMGNFVVHRNYLEE